MTNTDTKGFRLPTTVNPIHYDVTIKTDMVKSSFAGFTKIELDILQETSSIVFHSVDLELGKGRVYLDGSDKALEVISQTADDPSHSITIELKEKLKAGSKVQLHIAFRAPLGGSMVGYYKSSYTHKGTPGEYALTQFESTDARRAFPCWDEPLFKATFKFTLISRKGYVNLNNMPALSEEPFSPPTGTISELEPNEESLFYSKDSEEPSEWTITRFQKSVKMSTYIVAIASGHFEHLESSYTSPLSNKTKPLRIYATADVIHQAQFALDLKAKVVPLYEKIFDVEYPLPKLDTLIAHDFDAGAMENWGLITGRTNALLLDPERADISSKQQVVFTQSHEVAHMWFGNITTMAWWDNLYLNEGFATLMGEVIIPDKVYPEWKVNSRFVEDHLIRAFSLDAKLSSHPIEVPIPNSDTVDQIFDSLSYSKAASVLRMLADYVGVDVFLKGVSLYLKERLFSNSVTNDLWEGIGKASGVDIPTIMDPWVKKIGFPVVTVTETEKGIRVRQDRYLSSGPAEDKENETIWSIPLSLLTVDASGKPVIDKSLLLDEREKEFPLDVAKQFKLNAGTSGFYRVLYAPERLVKIGQAATKNDDIYSVADRMGLVYDAFALARSGHSKMSAALSLTTLFSNEKEYLVWSAVANALSGIPQTFWENEKVSTLSNKLRQTISVPVIERLGYENGPNDSDDTKMFRRSAIALAAEAGAPQVIAVLRDKFALYIKTKDINVIPVDLQRATFKAAVRYSDGRHEFEEMKKLYFEPPIPSAKTAAIAALCSSKSPALLKETLEFAIKDARKQDLLYFFGIMPANVDGKRLCAEFFKDHYDQIVELTGASTLLQRVVQSTFNSFTSKKDYDDIVKFFADKNRTKYEMNYKQALETVSSQAAFIERSAKDIEDWLVEWEKKAKL